MFITDLVARLSDPHTSNVDYDSLVKKVPLQLRIPHKVFQTNKSKVLVDTLADNVTHIKKLNPDWEYLLFDDDDIEEYLLHNYGETILGYYRRIDSQYGAAKADFFRYFLVYMEGGLYLDIKSSITKPLSEVFGDEKYILSFWDNLPGQAHEGIGYYSFLPPEMERGEVIQWYIASVAGHPILRKVILQMLYNIDHYNPYRDGVGWTGTMRMTGPIMYSKVIYDCLNNNYCSNLVSWKNVFEDFAFVYSIYEKKGDTTPYHVSSLSTDYRRAWKPLIKHKRRIIQVINEKYLSLMSHRSQ